MEDWDTAKDQFERNVLHSTWVSLQMQLRMWCSLQGCGSDGPFDLIALACKKGGLLLRNFQTTANRVCDLIPPFISYAYSLLPKGPFVHQSEEKAESSSWGSLAGAGGVLDPWLCLEQFKIYLVI